MERNECFVKNSYNFVEFLNTIKINDNELMASFDVVSLFTKIPVDLALEIARKRLESHPSEDLQERTNCRWKKFVRDLKFFCRPLILNFATNFSDNYMALLSAHQFQLWWLIGHGTRREQSH